MTKALSDLIDVDKEPGTVECSPIPADRLLAGTPQQQTRSVYEAEDCFFVGEWSAEPGCWRIHYTEHEYFHILEGKSIIRDAHGAERVLLPGDKLCVPAGFIGEWEVVEPTRKIYVIYERES
ncbi:MAG: cupin domain-containing protein [Halieaceae bacterium]|jgi:uncharacterized cupin superfamily protein|nr:cupin domain-containing protein [Halieaceae bacterium]